MGKSKVSKCGFYYNSISWLKIKTGSCHYRKSIEFGFEIVSRVDFGLYFSEGNSYISLSEETETVAEWMKLATEYVNADRITDVFLKA